MVTYLVVRSYNQCKYQSLADSEFKNKSFCKWAGESLLLLSVKIFPALENNLSDGTEFAITGKYLLAIVLRVG